MQGIVENRSRASRLTTCLLLCKVPQRQPSERFKVGELARLPFVCSCQCICVSICQAVEVTTSNGFQIHCNAFR